MRQDLRDNLPMEVTYSILKPFLADSEQEFVELPPYHEIDPSHGVCSRSVGVHVQIRLVGNSSGIPSQPFKDVEFTLHGIVKSQVGNRTATKRILRCTQVRKWSEFGKYRSGRKGPGSPISEEYYCDIIFPVRGVDGPQIPNPIKSSADVFQLLPSMSITSSKYTTQSTALTDRHVVSGRCDVVYWIEARFTPTDGRLERSDGPNLGKKEGRMITSSMLKIQPCPRKVRLVASLPAVKEGNRTFEVEAKRPSALRLRDQCRSVFSKSHQQDQVQPKIILSIQQPLSQSHTLHMAPACASTFIVPLTMTVSMPSKDIATESHRALGQYLGNSGFPNGVTVTSTWHTKYPFTTDHARPIQQDHEMEKHTVRQETCSLKFPPFYEITPTQFTAMADLEISIPVTTPATSNTGLLAVQHYLSIDIKIEGANVSDPVGNTGQERRPGNNCIIEHAVGMRANMELQCIVDV